MPKIIIKIIISIAILCSPAYAGVETFFEDIKGEWAGNGEVVAGKWEKTRFHCSFKGIATLKTAMELTGKCRSSIFTQPITANLKQTEDGSFKGNFLGGVDGNKNGINIISGKLKGNKLIVQLNRKKLFGAMVINHTNPNTIEVTISVQFKEKLIPFIGLTLNRKTKPNSES